MRGAGIQLRGHREVAVVREVAHGLEHFFLRDRVNRFGVAAFDAAAGAENFAAGGAVAHLEVLHEGGAGGARGARGGGAE